MNGFPTGAVTWSDGIASYENNMSVGPKLALRTLIKQTNNRLVPTNRQAELCTKAVPIIGGASLAYLGPIVDHKGQGSSCCCEGHRVNYN